MKKIASFTVDHDKLTQGVYISRIDGDITTFDLRFIKPNTPPFLKPYAMHTIEHLFGILPEEITNFSLTSASPMFLTRVPSAL